MCRRNFLVCLVLLVTAMTSVPAYAAVGVIWGLSAGSAWRLDSSGNAPAFQTNVITNFTTNENNAGGYANGNLQGLGQIFPISANMTVKCISMIVSGGAGDINVVVYEIGPTADFNAVTPDPCNFNTLTPLWSTTVTYNGSSSGVVLFNLSGADTFNLNANTKYAIVITELILNQMTWVRGTAGTLNGMMITTNGGGAGLNIWKNIRDYGGAPQSDLANVRQASLALYADTVTNANKATTPSPANAATDLSINTTLSWTADANATSHDVYFGTASPGTLQGNQAGTTFDPGTLENSTTYYWRIDERNASGAAVGDVWSFTTSSGKATEPSPADEETGVNLTPELTWTAGVDVNDTDGHDVYLGTSFDEVQNADTSSDVYIDTTTDASYQVTTMLTGDTIYYWRVDEVNDTDTWTGDVWSFTTATSKASSPSPANGATGVSRTPLLSWTASQTAADANGHEVYLGTDFNDVNDADNTDTTGIYLGDPTDPNHQIATDLDYSTTYYWRVDEVNDTDTWKGDVWHFTTMGLLTITKCKIVAGKTQGADETDVNNIKDTFDIAGTATFPSDLNGITTVDINIISENNDELIYEQTGIAFSVVKNKFSYSHKIPKGAAGEITSMKMDFVKNTFAIKAKNVDLTGIDFNDTLQLNLTMGNNIVSGTANETVINGSKRIPTRLMRMFGDTLVVTKAKAKHSTKPLSDSLSVTGEIAVEDINDANMDDPNLVNVDVNVVWGDQTFTIPADSFVAAKTGHSYKCSKITSTGADANDGLITGKIDLDKCTFTISVKEANDLNIGPDDVEFGLNFGEGDFAETADVDVVTGRSY